MEQHALPLVTETLTSHGRLERVKMCQGVFYPGVEQYAKRLHIPVLPGMPDMFDEWS